MRWRSVVRLMKHTAGFLRHFTLLPGAQRCQFNKIEGDHILKACCIREDLDIYTIKADALVREAQRRHEASPGAAAILGRLMMGTLLMNAIYPEASIVKVSLVGDGPIGYAHGVATDQVFAKAMVQFPQCEVPFKANGKIDVKAALGTCEVHIICDFARYNVKSKLYKFYLGPSGELAEAIAFFMREEDNIDTVASFAVTFDDKGTVNTARGYIGQIYPCSNKETCNLLLKNITNLPSLYDTSLDMDGHELINRLFEGIPLGEIAEPIVPQFGPCSQEALVPQMEEALVAYRTETLKKLIEDKEYLDVFCVFTTETVRLEKTVLQSALRKAEELDTHSWKKLFFMTPEVKWLECNPKYVGKRPGQEEEEEMKKKIPQKLVPYDAGLPSRIGAIRKDSYASVDRKLPPLSPFPKSPKRKPNKRKMFRRP